MSTDLERRIAELSEEIRRYPTPIARCDEQLAALLEERSRLLNELKKHDGDANAA
jgi:chorismate mutase